MTVCAILVGALIVVGIILKIFHRDDKVTRIPDAIPEKNREEECCGLHEICEKLNNSILSSEWYFDDEELDRYRGRDAADYSENEIEEFREVMVTLHRREIPFWGAALEKRGVSLPAELKDEFLILLSENK